MGYLFIAGLVLELLTDAKALFASACSGNMDEAEHAMKAALAAIIAKAPELFFYCLLFFAYFLEMLFFFLNCLFSRMPGKLARRYLVTVSMSHACYESL